MKKFIVGSLVALLVCATGIFAGLGCQNDAKNLENEKIPVASVPEGGLPVA